MTKKQDTVPEEPEQMRLWRQLIKIRDELVEEIPAYEQEDHPERQYLDRIAAVYGTHGRSERYLSEIDEQAKATAECLRKRVADIDKEIRRHTSEGSNDRGFNLKRLRALIEGKDLTRQGHPIRGGSIDKARKALEAWWDDPGDKRKRQDAQLRLHWLITESKSVPADFRQLPDLDALWWEDWEYRYRKDRVPSWDAERSCGRIMKRLRGVPVE